MASDLATQLSALTERVKTLEQQLKSDEKHADLPDEKRLGVEYTNSQGEVSSHNIIPTGRGFFWGVNPHTDKEAWMVEAWDSEILNTRLFVVEKMLFC